jgi:phosphodiesterase/alkaline phosphatase D-like protein
MARLIIGHTSHNLVRLWVRGDRRYPVAFLRFSGPGAPAEAKMELESRHGYTGVIEVKGLQEDSLYRVEVEFGRTLSAPVTHRAQHGHSSGKFRTFPRDTRNAPRPFSFLLGSCNLHSLDDISSDIAFGNVAEVGAAAKARFMIHCGDQIYYDIPNPLKPADLDEYRQKYLDAWGDSRATRRFFTQLPQYMILDDHEMENNFANDMDTGWFGSSVEAIRQYSLKAYREFQHIHNPQSFDVQSLYYHFDYANVRFFVLDTRTERYQERGNDSQIISPTQMSRFQAWLKKYKDDVKFVVTSVPFVGEIRDPGKDKWCSGIFKKQREGILRFIIEQKVTGLTFLTGDMHNSYHATMDLTANDGSHSVTLHELMSSPLNQLGKTTFDAYVSDNETPFTADGFSYLTRLSSGEFYCEHSNAMVIGVNGRKVDYRMFRTKKPTQKLPSGRYHI